MQTPPKFNSSPLKNGGLEDYFPIGRVTFQGPMLNFVRVGDLSMFPLLSATTFGWGRRPGSPTNCWEIPLVQKSLQHLGFIKTHFENLWNDWTNLPNLHYRKLTWQWNIHHLKMYLLLIMGIFQCHLSSQGCTFFGADFEQPNIIKTSSNKIGGSILRVVRVTFKAGIYLGGQGIKDCPHFTPPSADHF